MCNPSRGDQERVAMFTYTRGTWNKGSHPRTGRIAESLHLRDKRKNERDRRYILLLFTHIAFLLFYIKM